MRERLRSEPHARVACHCSSYDTSTALFPVVGHLARAAGIDDRDDAGARLDKLEALARRAGNDLTDTVPLLAALA